MAKLTLSVDERVIARAKEYAAMHSTSVSGLVERYLDYLTRSWQHKDQPPVLSRLRGIASGAHTGDYYEHLERKYR